jgi:hypothetical protein
MTQESTLTITDVPAPVQADPMAGAWRQAEALAKSGMIPDHFTNKPLMVFPIVQLAYDLNLPPLTVLQNCFMIGGKPGISAKMCIALCNRAQKFAGPIRFKSEGSGDDLAVTALAPLHDGDVVEVTVDLALARREGWTRNKKYQSMPEHMLRLRAATWLINLYCPEVLLGLEVGDTEYTPRAAVPAEIQPVAVKTLESKLLAVKNSAQTAQKEGNASAKPLKEKVAEEPSSVNDEGESTDDT